jgi:5-methylcytosine-specific restriction endonuclease McrA
MKEVPAPSVSKGRNEMEERKYAARPYSTRMRTPYYISLMKEKCWYCGNIVGDTISLDHQIPRSRGGLDIAENIVVCCRSCNSRKISKTVEEYREYMRIKRSKFSDVQYDFLKKNFN